MGSKRISNYISKPSSCLIYVCCHGGLLIALNLASNFGRTIFGWVGPVLASKTSPAGPNYVDQTWSGRTDFFPGPIFSLQTIYVLIGPFMLWHKWSGQTNYVDHKWSPWTTYARTIYAVTGPRII